MNKILRVLVIAIIFVVIVMMLMNLVLTFSSDLQIATKHQATTQKDLSSLVSPNDLRLSNINVNGVPYKSVEVSPGKCSGF